MFFLFMLISCSLFASTENFGAPTQDVDSTQPLLSQNETQPLGELVLTSSSTQPVQSSQNVSTQDEHSFERILTFGNFAHSETGSCVSTQILSQPISPTTPPLVRQGAVIYKKEQECQGN